MRLLKVTHTQTFDGLRHERQHPLFPLIARTRQTMADDTDTERVTFVIANPRTVNSERLYALVDVEVQVAGLSFRIIGVQIRHDGGGLTVQLPTHRDVTGIWRPVIEMPEELRAPLADAVMEFLAEEGLTEHRSGIRF